MLAKLIKLIFGSHQERELKKIRPIVDKINKLEDDMKKLSDEELRGKTEEFRKRLQNGGNYR